MNNVHHVSFGKQPTTFDVEVIFDAESGMWVADCEGLTLVTEAPTFEALCERVWLLAEDMGHENGLDIDVADMRLNFQHLEVAGQRAAG